MDGTDGRATRRWGLIRDALVFQIKLAVDGVRDLVLIPVSLVAAVVSLLTGGGKDGPFHEVVRLGQRTERWTNLFDAARPEADDPPNEGVDVLVSRLESMLLEQYRRGGMTAAAKQRIDVLLDRVATAPRKSTGTRDDTPPC